MYSLKSGWNSWSIFISSRSMVSRHDKCSFKKSTHVPTSAVQSCETDWIASAGVHPMACSWIAVNSHTLNQKQWTAASKYISNTLKYRLVNFQAKMQWELHRGSHCRQLYGAIRLCSWSCRTYVYSWLCNICQAHFVIFSHEIQVSKAGLLTTVAGDSRIQSMVALKCGCSITCNQVDTTM